MQAVNSVIIKAMDGRGAVTPKAGHGKVKEHSHGKQEVK